MAVETGMDRNNQEAAVDRRKLTQEQKSRLDKARQSMEIANSFRLFFLLIAVILLVFVHFGGKIWTGTAWYDHAVQSIYRFLLWDVLLMLISTFVKLFFAAKYNKLVKRL